MKKQNDGVKEPFLHIVRKKDSSRADVFRVTALSLVVALLICLIFILAVGKGKISIGNALKQMWQGTFGIMGNSKSMSITLWDTAIFTAKLLCIAVALAPAFKMKFWNIGAEGQIVIGGLVAALFMHERPEMFKNPLTFLLVILLSSLAGAVWGLIPAFFKAQWETNETLFTLMMNYVAMKIMDFFFNKWKGKLSSLPTFDESTWLPSIAGKPYTLNIIVFVLLAVLMYFYLKKTKHGYEIAVVGGSQNTARYAGINVKKVILRTMALSGGLCGLCGAMTVMGQTHNIAYSGEVIHGITNGYGFTAIIVAWLANFNTLAMILISFLIQFLQKGTGQLGNAFPVFATGAGNVLIGIVLFCIIGGAFFLNYRVIFSEKVKAFFHRKNAPPADEPPATEPVSEAAPAETTGKEEPKA